MENHDAELDECADPKTIADEGARDIIKCTWQALVHNPFGTADLVDKRYAAACIAKDLEDSGYRIVPANLVHAADGLHEATLARAAELMAAEAGTPAATELARVAEAIERYENQRWPIELANTGNQP